MSSLIETLKHDLENQTLSSSDDLATRKTLIVYLIPCMAIVDQMADLKINTNLLPLLRLILRELAPCREYSPF